MCIRTFLLRGSPGHRCPPPSEPAVGRRRPWDRCRAWALAACTVGAVAQVPEPQPITQLKRMVPRTVLAEAGKARCLLLVPDGEPYTKLGNEFAARLRELAGASPEVARASALVSEDWSVALDVLGGRTAVALGNVNNNRLLAVLYGQRYVVADSIYPGRGGYVVRTVHDPFATGVNVLVLAGSDAAGVEKATSVFFAAHVAAHEGSAVLDGPIVDVELERRAYPFFPDASHSLSSKRQPQYTGMEWFREQMQRTGFADEQGGVVENRRPGANVTSLTGLITRMGQTYFRTGNAELPGLMKRVLDRNRHLLAVPDRLHEMQSRSAWHVPQWDLLEELSVWTDVDRLDITNALLRDAALGHERRAFHKQVADGAVMAMDENHGTASARNSFVAWQYFHKYYPSPASEYWMRCAKAVFSAQASTFQILEDASGYLCYGPIQTMDYALRSGDLTVFRRGVARHHARTIATMCMNNLGLNTGFGDSASVVNPEFFEALAPAAWFHRDPKLYWIIRNRLHPNCGLRIFQSSMAFDLDIEPEEPTDWAGLVRVPLYASPLAKGEASPTLVFAEADDIDLTLFNKLVFRENWDPDGQYLLLDGAGAWAGPPGPHGHKHDDINTIINFTAHGRMWLVDHTYQLRSFQDHSGLYVLRNGSGGFRKRTLTTLLDFMDSDTFGLTRSRFMDWERSLFWRKGRYFVVIDSVVADEPGDYFARCSWRALGEPDLRTRELALEQSGRYCRIVSDGASRLDVTSYRFTDSHWESFYEHAEPVVRIFQQDKHRALGKGDRLGFANLLYAYGSSADARRVLMRPVTEHCVLVVDDGAELVIGTEAAGMPGGALDADLFVVGGDEIMLAGARSVGHGLAGFLPACDVRLDLADGEMETNSGSEIALTLSPAVAAAEVDGVTRRLAGNRLAVPPGRHRVRIGSWPGWGQARSCRQAVLDWARLAADEREKREESGEERMDGADALVVESFDVGMPVAALCLADVSGSGANECVVGGGNGVSVVAADGAVLWHAAAEKPVRAVDARPLTAGGPVRIVAGGDDEQVRLLDGSGKELWRFVRKPCAGSIDGPPAVDYVRIADLEHDGDSEVVVGANWVHVLDGGGRVKWEKYMALRRGRITGDFVAGDISDIDGDGRKEIAALFMTSYPLALIYDAQGAIVMPAGEEAGHEGLNIDVPFAAAVLDLFGMEGAKQLVYGGTSRIGFAWHDQKRGEQAGGKFGGAFVAMACYEPANGTPPTILAADSMCGVRAIRARPKRDDRWINADSLWYRTVGEKVTALAAADLDGDGAGELLVGTKNGRVLVLGVDDGAVRASGTLGSPVKAMLADPASGRFWAGTESGRLARLSQRP